MRRSGKLGRKGMEMSSVMTAVIGAIVLVIIVMIADKFYTTAKDKLEVQDCKNSIGAHALLAQTTEREVFTDIKCQTRELTVDASNQEKAKKTIAEDMRRCWYEWLKGDAQLFKGEGIFCHVCSIYDFKQNDTTIAGFQTFLLTKNIDISSVYPEDTKRITYAQYFQGYSTAQRDKIESTPNKTEFTDTALIDTSKKYATIFVYASGKDDMQKFMEGGARTGVFVAGSTVAGVGALLLLAGPAGWAAEALLVTAIGAMAVIESFTFEPPQWMSFVDFTEYNSTLIKNLGCQYLTANQMSHQQ